MATQATAVSAEEYERIAVAEEWHRWELHEGRLREKPPMASGHEWAQAELIEQLVGQLDRRKYRVRSAAHLRTAGGSYYIPDACVAPLSLIVPPGIDWQRLNAFAAPLPLVVEVWSPSTGDYDLDQKVPEYQRRGDREIWRLHPFRRAVTVWRRQPDGSYVETIHAGGTITLRALPDVAIDLDALFPPASS